MGIKTKTNVKHDYNIWIINWINLCDQFYVLDIIIMFLYVKKWQVHLTFEAITHESLIVLLFWVVVAASCAVKF